MAFHDVTSPADFERQLIQLRRGYTPVSLDQVTAWTRGGELPARAVWLTFDDGHPDVVERGLPLLVKHGFEATMFVCPGFIDTNHAFWWDRVAPELAAQLKRLPDEERRRVIESTSPVPSRQLTTSLLNRWVATGQRVGNHTWDHPCLNMCASDEQARQVRLAHDWLLRAVGPSGVTAFAYPNGNHSEPAEAELRRLGYDVGLLFDHALTRRTEHLRLSRLRLDADAPEARVRAVASGLHSSALAFRRRTRGR
jgi:peptidoglycan/xylan/chitin deacetylase (PgdA/CDA1 family)